MLRNPKVAADSDFPIRGSLGRRQLRVVKRQRGSEEDDEDEIRIDASSVHLKSPYVNYSEYLA